MKESGDKSLSRTLSLKKLPSIPGSSDFVEKLKTKFFEQKSHMEAPESKQLARDMERIKKRFATITGSMKLNCMKEEKGSSLLLTK
jgi:hypothetical protein